jgi:hypothetical protein
VLSKIIEQEVLDMIIQYMGSIDDLAQSERSKIYFYKLLEVQNQVLLRCKASYVISKAVMFLTNLA